MEKNQQINSNFSLDKHKNKNAIMECEYCDIKLCNECSEIHSKFLPNHHLIEIKDSKIFNFKSKCSYDKHKKMALNYDCENHNELCCALCLCVKQDDYFGIHNKCKILSINEIKNIKKQNLNNNIKKLDEFLKLLNEKKDNIANILKQQEENKEDIKKKIANYFTQIRNIINEREDELIKIIDEKFNVEKISNEELKNYKIISKESKYLLEIGNEISKNWDENLNIEMLQKCIKIEKMNEKLDIFIKKLNEKENNNKEYYFYPIFEDIEKFKKNLKNYAYFAKPLSFKSCPKDLNSYKISGKNRNIVTKTDSQYVGAIIDTPLEKNSITKWTIKILSIQIPHICLGVAPSDYDLYMKSPYYFGWTLHINSYSDRPTLYSGSPHNYSGASTSLSIYDYNKCNEISLIMNTKEGKLSYILNNEKPIECFSNIPLDKPLSPVVYFDKPNDSMEINLDYIIKI